MVGNLKEWTPTFRTLTKADRCDRCGAQAFAQAQAKGRSELLFCAHHLREHSESLKAQKFFIRDDSEALTQGS